MWESRRRLEIYEWCSTALHYVTYVENPCGSISGGDIRTWCCNSSGPGYTPTGDGLLNQVQQDKTAGNGDGRDPLAIPLRSQSPDASVPSFAKQDVVKYVSTHPIPRAISSGSSTVANVSFMTSGAASKMLRGEPIGLPYNSLVSVVEVHGNYILPNLLTIGTATQVFEVFDAHTGSLLMVSFLQ